MSNAASSAVWRIGSGSEDPREFAYRIDADDVVIGVSAPWLEFARENGAASLDAYAVLGRRIWDFVHGIETQSVYRAVFRTVRAHGTCRTLPMRCDAPAERRDLELEVCPVAGGGIELVGRIVASEPRPPVAMLDASRPRRGPPVELCSFCRRLGLPGSGWVELEGLPPYEVDPLPEVQHGLCDRCAGELAACIDQERRRPA